jgi:sugar/nucleoside kinase (ribokinase family)
MKKQIDCVVCGSCTVDILVKPVDLHQPLGADHLYKVAPIEATTGGIVSNSGTALARLGMRTAACTTVGNDEWGQIVRRRYAAEGINTSHLATRNDLPTSTTVVLIDSAGQRSFAHCQGAPKRLDREFFLRQLDFFAISRAMLLGYYSLLPDLEHDLPEVFAAIRATGCLTAMDAAGSGGGIDPLCHILPHLDIYVPSLGEAQNQTGCEDPQAIIEVFRGHGATGLLGVKLGSRGALLSPAPGEFVMIDAVTPPGAVIDTTGAGDAFYAGLITGLLRGMSIPEAGRLAAAAGACCVTGLGASAGLRGFAETMQVASGKQVTASNP